MHHKIALVIVEESNLVGRSAAKVLLQGPQRAFAIGLKIMNAFDIGAQEPHDSLPVATDMTLRRAKRGARPRQFKFLGATPWKRFGSTLVDQEQSGLTGDSGVDLPGQQSGSHLRNAAHLKDIDVGVRLKSGSFSTRL